MDKNVYALFEWENRKPNLEFSKHKNTLTPQRYKIFDNNTTSQIT